MGKKADLAASDRGDIWKCTKTMTKKCKNMVLRDISCQRKCQKRNLEGDCLKKKLNVRKGDKLAVEMLGCFKIIRFPWEMHKVCQARGKHDYHFDERSPAKLRKLLNLSSPAGFSPHTYSTQIPCLLKDHRRAHSCAITPGNHPSG